VQRWLAEEMPKLQLTENDCFRDSIRPMVGFSWPRCFIAEEHGIKLLLASTAYLSSKAPI
jgi:hypothetical protein